MESPREAGGVRRQAADEATMTNANTDDADPGRGEPGMWAEEWGAGK